MLGTVFPGQLELLNVLVLVALEDEKELPLPISPLAMFEYEEGLDLPISPLAMFEDEEGLPQEQVMEVIISSSSSSSSKFFLTAVRLFLASTSTESPRLRMSSLSAWS